MRENLVREMGLEPTRQRHWNLNPARLPIPPLAREPVFEGDEVLHETYARKQCSFSVQGRWQLRRTELIRGPRKKPSGCERRGSACPHDRCFPQDTGVTVYDQRLAGSNATDRFGKGHDQVAFPSFTRLVFGVVLD